MDVCVCVCVYESRQQTYMYIQSIVYKINVKRQKSWRAELLIHLWINKIKQLKWEQRKVDK